MTRRTELDLLRSLCDPTLTTGEAHGCPLAEPRPLYCHQRRRYRPVPHDTAAEKPPEKRVPAPDFEGF